MTMTVDVQTIAVRSRSEAMLTCPGCGSSGNLRRIGGGAGASRFRCESYRYDPNHANTCYFVFTVDDRQLRRFA